MAPKKNHNRPGFTVGDDEHQQQTTTASSSQAEDRPPRRDPALRLPKFTTIPNSTDGTESDDEWHPSSGPQTPNIIESAQQLRRSLSVHGLHELANMPSSEIRKSVGKKIWRPQDEEVRVPSDWERLAVHVVRGGIRGFNLAFMLRGSVMIVFALIRAFRKKQLQGKSFLIALFGAENIRFSLMFAAWTTLYKAAHNSFRLLTPIPPSKSRPNRSRSDPARLQKGESQSNSGYVSAEDIVESGTPSGTATPRSGWSELEGKEGEERANVKSNQKKRAFMKDPRSRVWHAYVAGAISGLAIMFEKKDSRVSLAQQLLVRGLEGTYNSAHSKGLINIPNGAVLSFGLACGQIMYAWLNCPQTLPRSYVSWITGASHIAPPALDVHRDLMSTGRSEGSRLYKLFPDDIIPEPLITSDGSIRYANVAPNKHNRRGIAGENVAKLVNWMKRADDGGKSYHIPCEAVHPWETSHFWSPVDRFVEVTRWILPVYMTLHFVPAVFLRMKAFRKDPIRVFLRSLFGSLRSSSFLGFFVIIFQTTFCTFNNMHDYIITNPTLEASLPNWLKRFLVSTMAHWTAGFLTCMSLFVEHKRRRTELAMYVLPKGMESAWSVARQRAWVPFVPGGDLLLTSAGMSLIMGSYAQNPTHLSGLVRRIVYQFVGRN